MRLASSIWFPSRPPPRLRCMTIAGSAPLPYLIVRRLLVEPEQEPAGLRRHDRTLVVLSGKGAHGQERVEPHDRHELDPIRYIPPQQVDALKPRDPALDDSAEDLRLEERFVGVRVLPGGPAAPNPADHGDLSGMREGVAIGVMMGVAPDLERLKQLARHRRYAVYCALERCLVGLRRNAKAADLAHELQGRVLQFGIGRRVIGMAQPLDVSAHDGSTSS